MISADAGRRLSEIWLTHHHGDHIGAAAHLVRTRGAILRAHPETRARLPRALAALCEPLMPGSRRVGPLDLDILHTPGHAPGHLVFIDRGSGLAVVGDMVAGTGNHPHRPERR